MEVHEEELVMGSKDNNSYKKKLMMMIKGKRTKLRQRLPSPPSLTMTSTSPEEPQAQVQAQDCGPADSTDNSGSEFNGISTSGASPTNSVNEFTGISTQVEQDMANCLILLAQTPRQAQQQLSQPGLYANYQCKTCERCFPSFQALGGHRASHKRPKPSPPALQHHMNNVLPMDNDQQTRFDHNSTITNTTLSLQIPSKPPSSRSVFNTSNNINKSSKVHECSICGSEFGSGQALGGHMRRHRTILSPMATTTSPTPAPNDQESNKKPRNILSLDLNLPAPDDQEPKFPFALKDQVIVFSASALVDCHTS